MTNTLAQLIFGRKPSTTNSSDFCYNSLVASVRVTRVPQPARLIFQSGGWGLGDPTNDNFANTIFNEFYKDKQ